MFLRRLAILHRWKLWKILVKPSRKEDELVRPVTSRYAGCRRLSWRIDEFRSNDRPCACIPASGDRSTLWRMAKLRFAFHVALPIPDELSLLEPLFLPLQYYYCMKLCTPAGRLEASQTTSPPLTNNSLGRLSCKPAASAPSSRNAHDPPYTACIRLSYTLVCEQTLASTNAIVVERERIGIRHAAPTR